MKWKLPSQIILNLQFLLPLTHFILPYIDASLLGIAAKLFPANTDNKMQVMTYNSRILTTQEQKLSTYDSAICPIAFAVSKYELLIIKLQIPNQCFSDQNPILFSPLHS